MKIERWLVSASKLVYCVSSGQMRDNSTGIDRILVEYSQ